MDFGFSQEQEQLRAAVRDFLSHEAPVSLARAMMSDPRGPRDDLWRGLADLGWLGLTVEERYGGSGLGNLELALVMEEMGRVVFAAPYASTVSLAVPVIVRLGDAGQRADLLPDVVAGKRRVTCAIAERPGRWTFSGIAGHAEMTDEGYSVSAEKLFVPDARMADVILVACECREGLGVFVVPGDCEGLRVEPMQTVDATRKLDVVELHGACVGADALLGRNVVTGEVLDAIIDVAKTALSAELCGLADAAIDMSVKYVKVREQFGRPIGSFQAIQHRLADMKVVTENAKSLVYYAAWALDQRSADAPLAAAMAKAYASDVCPSVVADAIQVHGGVGFTWEHDLHLYFKRAKASEVTYGDAVENRGLVAALLPLEAS